jgi:hypothetical protein
MIFNILSIEVSISFISLLLILIRNKFHKSWLFLLINNFLEFEGGIRMAEMLFRTNIIGFVGTGNNPSYSSKRLILWDDI